MSTKDQATPKDNSKPRPYRIGTDPHIIHGADGTVVCQVGYSNPASKEGQRQIETARLIVKAVNCHNDFKYVAQGLVSYCEAYGLSIQQRKEIGYYEAKQALSKAQEGI